MLIERKTSEKSFWLQPAAMARAMLLRSLRGFRLGRITIETPKAERLTIVGSEPGPEVTLVVHRWRGVWRLLRGGDVGFAEAYIDGDLWSPDLVALLQWATLNERELRRTTDGSRLARLTGRFLHFLNENTKWRARRNIAAHYDLGNSFYRQWLDPSMTYSSALFTDANQTLEEAQAAKIDHAIKLLDVERDSRVLEIGIGWGAMARALAAHGANVTGVTLSTEQLTLASNRVRESGVADATDLRLQDYRDVEGEFDRIVSIEMIEAVGERYWPVFFRTVRDRLKPHGIAVLQAITIDVSRFADYRARPDFIQRYIFPGGMLLTAEAIKREAERAGLALVKADMFGESYARTLAEWQRRFQNAWPSIQSLGFDQRFKRMWEYYLAYCETGFRLGTLDVGQYKLEAR
jgi:cyclopropane-fatty-acyl-phospholipid synthase